MQTPNAKTWPLVALLLAVAWASAGFKFCPGEEEYKSGRVSFTAHAVKFAGGTTASGSLRFGRDPKQ